MERIKELVPLWAVLGFFAAALGALGSIPAEGTPVQDYATYVRMICYGGVLICFLIGVLALVLERLRRFSKYLGRGIRASARFMRDNALLVGFVLFSILLLLLLGRLFDNVAVPAIAAALILANVGITIGILRIVRPRYASRPPDFFDTFDGGLSRWESLCRPSAARTIMAFQGRAHCLHMPPYSHQRPEIMYVAGLDDFRNGLIECDVYLPTNTLINILFRAHIPAHRYYGARLDTRPQGPNNYPLFDKFLRRDGGFPKWFGEAPDRGAKTTPNEWHHLKVMVAQNSMELFSDEQLVASWVDSMYHSGQVGIMAELGEVCVDNFRVTPLPSPLRIGQL